MGGAEATEEEGGDEVRVRCGYDLPPLAAATCRADPADARCEVGVCGERSGGSVWYGFWDGASTDSGWVISTDEDWAAARPRQMLRFRRVAAGTSVEHSDYHVRSCLGCCWSGDG
eukprot:3415359-Rhodomonas_salina.4